MNIKYTILGLALLSNWVTAQELDKPNGDGTQSAMYEFTVEKDILNLEPDGSRAVQVYSASGQMEDVNKSAWSAHAITREEIIHAGATTIPEALRLMPGLIVKQKTNGNYEVYIRNMEASPIAGTIYDIKSKQVLVMIDNMPINDMFQGGVFWETLPISVGDVQRIEVVAGPGSVLFGQDAVSGIINIITVHPQDNQLNINIESQGGLDGAFNNASLSFGVQDKLKVRLSGKYISTRRFQDEFYMYNDQDFVESDQALFYQPNALKTNLYPDLARDDYGLNAFLQYSPSKKVNFKMHIARQNSKAQDNVYELERIGLTQRNSVTDYANLNASLYGLNLQASYMIGEQDLAVGYGGYRYDLNRLNAKIDYDYEVKGVMIKPGVSLQKVEYDDTAYPVVDQTFTNALNGSQSLMNYAAFVKAGYQWMENKFKLDAGARYESFDYNGQGIFSYQAAATYTPIQKALLRVAYSTGTSGAKVNDIYNSSSRTNLDGVLFNYQPNADLKLQESDLLEFGARVNMFDKVQLNVTYFMGNNNNASFNSITEVTTDINDIQVVNDGLRHSNSGITADIDMQFSGNLGISAFFTYQNVRYDDATVSTDLTLTPSGVGGATATYSAFLDRLNITGAVYYYGSHSMLTNQGVWDISAKLIPSLKASYKVWHENAVFINARNFLDNEEREFIYSDLAPGLYLMGLDLKF